MKTICIMCPMGCALEVEKDVNGAISVKGNTCKRGALYGEQEMTCPYRTVTSLIEDVNGRVYSVKTSKTVAKSKIFDILLVLKQEKILPPTSIGQVIIENVCGSGADIVITGGI